jgi:hypothetical protein
MRLLNGFFNRLAAALGNEDGYVSLLNNNIGSMKFQQQNDVETSLLNHSHAIVTSTGLNTIVAGTPGVSGYVGTAYITVFCINGRQYLKAATATANIVTGSIRRGGVKVAVGGTGYAIGDILNLTTTGSLGTVIVSDCVAGVVTEVRLVASGYSYTSGLTSATTVNFSPTGVTGTGCTVLISDVEAYTKAAVSTFTNFLITLASDGTVVGTQAPSTVADTSAAPLPTLPDCPLWQAPIGIVTVATDTTHTFLVGAAGSYSGQAGITMTYKDLSSVLSSVYAI